MPRPRGFHLWANLSYPVAWSALILLLAGEMGSSDRTLNLSYWFLSWFGAPSQTTLLWCNFILRKGSHLLLYGILFLLWSRPLQQELDWSPSWATFASFAVCLFLALLDEAWQAGTPGRHASSSDILLDLTAAGIAALLSWRLRRTPAAAPSATDCQTRII